MNQPTALFLADILEDAGKPADIAEKAAAELRRLHAELERCKQVCAATSEAWREEAALAEPVQGPIGYLWPTGRHPEFRFTQQKRDGVDGTPLYTSPPQRKPLTEEEIAELARQEQFLLVCDGLDQLTEIARAIERAHGIGGQP